MSEYLDDILTEAEELMDNADEGTDASEIAWHMATEQSTRAIVGSWRDYANLELLKEIREQGDLMMDSIEPHVGNTPTSEMHSAGEAQIEAIIINSLEKLIYNHLTEN